VGCNLKQLEVEAVSTSLLMNNWITPDEKYEEIVPLIRAFALKRGDCKTRKLFKIA
jgi:hypothetical protein